MRATVTLRLPSGEAAVLGPGDIIGRLWSAALHLDDARISEAHAMVSLRGQELQLLALRGRFAINGKPQARVVLRPGLVVELARKLPLVVEEVTLPARVLAVEAEGLPRQVLTGVCGLRLRPRPGLVAGYHADVDALLWSDGDQWRLRVGDQEPQAITPDSVAQVGALTVRFVAVSLDDAALEATRLQGTAHRPLRIVARHDTAHIYKDDVAALSLAGIAARLLSELATIVVPVSWESLAQPIWPDESDRTMLRRRLDINLARLRRKLRDAGLRGDLIRADGFGHYELLLYRGDQIVDET